MRRLFKKGDRVRSKIDGKVVEVQVHQKQSGRSKMVRSQRQRNSNQQNKRRQAVKGSLKKETLTETSGFFV